MPSPWKMQLCLAAHLLALPAAVGGARADTVGGIPATEEEQYWAFLDSAAALYGRGLYQVALEEIDEALALRPGDAEAAALRTGIVAHLAPPAAAGKAVRGQGVDLHRLLCRPEPETATAIDLNQAAFALAGGEGRLGPAIERWRELVLSYAQAAWSSACEAPKR